MSDNNAIGKKKRGRPRTGKAMDGSIFLRIPSGRKEEVREVVRAFLEGLPVPEAKVVDKELDPELLEAVVRLERENASLKAQLALKAKETPVAAPVQNSSKDVMALLESNEELTKEVAGLKGALARCSEASDDQKTHWWRAKYNALVAAVTAKHGSAEFSQ